MKTKKPALNIITDVIPLIIVSILGIFKVKLFINYLGNETFGLYNLFSNIMVYVSLVDGGLASAVLFSLYKPNMEGDRKKFNALLSGAFKTFSKIGMIVFGIAFIVSFFVIFFIKNSPFDYWYIVLTFLLFSLSNVLAYFFVPYNALLEVKEKKYLYNLTMQGGQIVLSILEIVMLVMGFKFGYILLMHSIVKLLTHLIEVIICKKEFPDATVFAKEKDYSFKEHLPSLIFHKICGLVSSNIDTIIISSFLGLNYVAIYSAYNYIVNMMKNILGKLSSSMTAIIGNILVKSKEQTYDLFLEFSSMLFFIAIIICIPLTLAINGFIDIYYEAKIDTSFLIAFSFCLILFSFIIKQCTTVFVTAGGLYKQTRTAAMVDALINLVLSLTLIHFIGISGVLLATAFSVFIAEYFIKTIVIHKNIFNKSSKYFFIKNIKFFVLYFIDLYFGYKIISLFDINSLLNWFLIFTIFTIANGLIILGVFKLFDEIKFINRLKILIHRSNI